MSPAVAALGSLCASFAVMLVGLRLRMGLWLCVLAGSACLALLTGIPAADFAGVFPGTLGDKGFVSLSLVLCLILVLSGVQAATGQNLRMVAALESLLRSRKLRLLFFPALVGLLPMPGGALFSCPMLESAARRMDLDPRRKTAVNYWFRHIWEPVWPLYPGYILTCTLLNLPLSALATYTFPLLFISLASGWFFLLRDLPPEKEEERPADPAERRKALRDLLYESLPIGTALLGAVPASLLADALFPGLPGGAPFAGSLAAAVAVALAQGGTVGLLPKILFSRNTGGMLLLIFMIFVFKSLLEHSGIIPKLDGFGSERWAVLALFILLPFVCGALTGVMVAYVGTSFPILIGLAAHAGLQEMTMPLFVLAIIAGNIGEMVSPLHVCLAVSCEYFKVGAVATIRQILGPVLVLLFAGGLWCLILAAWIAP